MGASVPRSRAADGDGEAAGVREAAPAKLNLSLHVVGRRSDGYHLLESLVVFTCAGDQLALEADARSTLEIDGPFAAGLEEGSGNLAARADEALREAYGPRVRKARMRLTKNLPVASGLGGGSADAAAVLRGLCRLSGLDADRAILDRIALSLGADVPACLRSRAAFMTGIGESLAEIPALPSAGVLLVNPGVALSTAAVFRELGCEPGVAAGREHPPLPAGGWRDAAALAAFLRTCRNDLEPAARAIAPEIGQALSALSAVPGALIARMSGSGATCFALFAGIREAAAAEAFIRRRHPGWWILSTELR